MTPRLLSYIILACIFPKAQAQELFFRHFTIDDGLSSNEVHSIREDSSRKLWLATDRGIMQYDGYQFHEMKVTGAPQVYPWFGIYKDKISADLYFLGFRGKVAVYKDGSLFLLPYNEILKKHHNGTVASSFMSRHDSIWINYDLANLLLLTPGGKIIKKKDPPGFHFNTGEGLHYLTGEWKQEQEKQPIFITWDNGQVTTDSILLPAVKHIDFLRHERIGNMDVFITGIQISCYQRHRKLWHMIFPTDILSFQVLDKQQVLIGMRNGGVSLYGLDSNGLHGPRQSWLKDLSVTNIHRDFQGGLWFTTIENGLFYANPTLARYYTGPGKIIFIISNNGKVFTGYQSGMIQVLHGSDLERTLQLPLEKNESLTHYTFNADGALVVATNRHLFIQNDKGIFVRTNYPSRPDPSLTYPADTGITHITHPLPIPVKERHLLPDRVTSVHEDGEGRVWIGTMSGLYLYHGDSLISLSSYYPVFSDRIVGLGTLGEKWLVAATLGNGIILYHQGVIHLLNNKNGLPATIINDMEIDGDTIWLGTNKGISKVMFGDSGFQVSHYGKGYGLPTLGIHQLAVSEGRIYFNWTNKLVVMEKSRLQQVSPVASPFITSVVVNTSDSCALSGADLKYNQNTIKIGFTSINLANGPGQTYRYRLTGLDEEWYTTTERQAIFVNLSPGKYIFVVEVADAQGVFRSSSASYPIVIHPAFWQQWWFPYMIGILLLLIILLIFQNHLRSLKSRSRLLLDLAESQQKALVQLINPHFIFNVLNTFSSAVATDDKMNALIIISRFTKLIRMSIRMGRLKNVKLSEEISLLEKYLELETIRFPGKFSYEIILSPQIDPNITKIPTMLIQPFVENAIKHGVLHLFERKGRISVRFEPDNGLILCTVEDNGAGREAATQINSRKGVNHEPAGIPITLNRLQLLHREQQKEYIYRITDLQDEAGAPAGTKVILSIPFILKTTANDTDDNRR